MDVARARFGSLAWIVSSPVVVLGLLSVAEAQQKESALAAGVGAARKFVGADQCAVCHGVDFERTPALARLVSRDFCLQSETLIYLTDKHLDSRELLTKELGKQIGERMQIADVSRDRRCLTCHAFWDPSWPKDEPAPESALQKTGVSILSGVSCESCHGMASGWLEGHRMAEKWRTMDPSVKEKEHGLIDLRNPIRRSQQCFSCHIGDAAEDKVVTHEMYAAGHPPLPGIEVANHSEAMPSHWLTLREKGDFKFRAGYIAANLPDWAEDEGALANDLPTTRSVLVGGVVALRQSVELVAELSKRQEEWPEFSAFDCQSCHHDLRIDGIWAARQVPGRAGRPRLPQWTAALIPVAIEAVDKNPPAKLKEFNDALHSLYTSVGKAPFGDAKATQAAVQPLVTWLDEQAASIVNSPIDVARADKAIDRLLASTPEEFPDFHSARQIAWAIRSIQLEMRAGYPPFKPRTMGSSEEGDLTLLSEWKRDKRAPGKSATFKLFDGGDANDAKTLASMLRLDLPSGQEKSIRESLNPFLNAIAAYRPTQFQKELSELSGRIKADPPKLQSSIRRK